MAASTNFNLIGCVLTTCIPGVAFVHEKEAAIIENCGKFSRVAEPGCFCIVPVMEAVRTTVDLKIKQIDLKCSAKTHDNVFIEVVLAILYKIIPNKVSESYYKFSDPTAQIQSYVFDVVRSSFPKLTLDQAFASKDHVAQQCEDTLAAMLLEVGFEVVDCLVVDINPDHRIKASMNDVVAQSRMREANVFKADADKILNIKAAEAEAESKYLSGLGVARQRKAIVDGLKDVVADFSQNVSGATAQDVLDLLLITQYFDVMKDIARKPQPSAPTSIFLPHGPASIKLLKQDLRNQIGQVQAQGKR